MATSCSFTFNPLQWRELSNCKCFSNYLNNSTHFFSRSFACSSPKQSLTPELSLFFLVKPPVTALSSVKTATFPVFATHNASNETINLSPEVSSVVVDEKFGRGFVNNGKPNERTNLGIRTEKGSSRSSYKRVDRKRDGIKENVPTNSKGHVWIRKKGTGMSSEGSELVSSGAIGVGGSVHRQPIKGNRGRNESVVKDKDKNKKKKKSKKSKVETPEFRLRVGLDMCSKKGDVEGAISLYDSAVKEEVKMGQYHYTVLLYLCSSAAVGVVRPAKSGRESRSLDTVVSQNSDENDSEDEEDDDDMDGDDDTLDVKEQTKEPEVVEIRVSDDVKKLALDKGFEIYERMCLDKVQMNEASLTSIARMAMAMGKGDMAFDMVKQMKSLGINPKLRSYGPALSVFSSSGDVEKAFAVEKHMLENGVQPEEPELEALLRVGIQNSKADRVYYVLHKLRTKVRSVSPSTADLIEKWFESREASRVGKRKWDPEVIAQTMENVGGGWHGTGWLGTGKWAVSRTSIGADGLCKCCGQKLALIDLDPEETERFAESVASIAIKRERNASFQKFQRWLDYRGPFDAVVDGANVGIFSQGKFKPSKINVVVNGIRSMLPNRKWPLIVLHNRRLTGGKMDAPLNKGFVDKWTNADALYATPTGSNDDWYWLYAAIKCRCLLVTNDEMRDHTFQLLGTDFFPKWKERHQVRFSISEAGPVFYMPPPFSVVIQESEMGHWHVPIASEHQSEEERAWLCVSRQKLLSKKLDDPMVRLGAKLREGGSQR